MLNDTIAAVSSPRGKGGVALLRISGPDAVAIASKVFRPKSGKQLIDLSPRTAAFGEILAPDTEGGVWLPIDDGLATVFPSPASFTGEDVVEICCHGGILLTETVLGAVLSAGARQAEAGEFTRRSFINGKMKLDSAEALGNLLEATSREQIRISHAGMQGLLAEAIRGQYDALCRVMSSVYATIDFPDEDLAEMTRDQIHDQLASVGTELSRLQKTYGTGHAIAEGIPTVICGAVNAGKSTLYNLLVGRDAAIVTAVEGTTRDVLEETVPCGKVTLRLADTAGLRNTEDPVEIIGIDRAMQAIRHAELILAVFDGTRPLDDRDRKLIDELKDITGETGGKILPVITKQDMGTVLRPEELPFELQPVTLSGKTGEGLDSLQTALYGLFVDGSLNTAEDAIVFNARQHSALLLALEALQAATRDLDAGLPMDIVSESIEGVMRQLLQIDGRQVSEDVVSGIFAHFCVGK